MNIETIRNYCLSKPYVTEHFPFDDSVMVFKIGVFPADNNDKESQGKMFLLISLDRPDYMMVKCDPDEAVELREQYPNEIEGAFHMNKKHWNGVYLGRGRLTDTEIREMIDRSYDLVTLSLPRWVRDIIQCIE